MRDALYATVMKLLKPVSARSRIQLSVDQVPTRSALELQVVSLRMRPEQLGDRVRLRDSRPISEGWDGGV